MEYAPSGSLLDYVRSRKRLGEPESCFFLQQIVAGLRYCHDNEVRTTHLHRLVPSTPSTHCLYSFYSLWACQTHHNCCWVVRSALTAFNLHCA
jgi:serine/threonine protein kinase